MVTELFEKAMKIPARHIRCTSVDGYRLPVGADTDEQLRREVFDARAFIGLITPEALESPYVLFELGARWGARRHLAPVLARGADSSYLGGPLSGINALRLGERNQVVQLVDDISEYLKVPLEPGASFQTGIDAVVSAALDPSQRRDNRVNDEPPELDEIEVRMMEIIGRDPPQQAQPLARAINLPLEKANYHLHRLLSAGMLEVRRDLYGRGDYYDLQQRGRVFLVERGLL